MKLNEIFNVEPATDLEKDNGEMVGQGSYADVSQSNSDPHMINRITTRKDSLFDEDAFEIYAAHIIRDRMAESNPTFPRIYKQSNGKYQVEKLIRLKDIDKEELFHYIINNFNYEQEFNERELQEYLKSGAVIFIIVVFINQAISENNFEVIKNKNIKEACRYIAKLAAASGKHPDIHSGNIMFRRTPVGIQLVLTDPII